MNIYVIKRHLHCGRSRLRTTAALAGARIPISVDIGFGDAIAPGNEDVNLPVLLVMPSPHLRAYPPETVIAEKVHAMVALRLTNSRNTAPGVIETCVILVGWTLGTLALQVGEHWGPP